MPGVINEADLWTGLLSKTSLVGPSVAKAKLPRLSMIKLTYNNYNEVNGDSSITAAPKKAIIKATTFTVS